MTRYTNEEETMPNPHEFNEEAFEELEGELADALAGLVRKMWEAGATAGDIEASIATEAQAAIRARTS